MKLVLCGLAGASPDKLAGRTEPCDVMMAKLVRSVPFTEKTEPGNSMKSAQRCSNSSKSDFWEQKWILGSKEREMHF